MTYKVRETDTHVYFLNGPYSQWFFTLFHGKLKQDGPVLQFKYREQYMMARKAMLFGDLKTLDAIMAAKKPWEHKALGRVVCGFTEEQWKQYAAPLWEEHCDDIVFQGNWFTSQYCEEYRDVLLASGDKHIVEGSAQDKIWGVGVSWDDPAILDPANWRGGPNNNRLGKAHMKVRHHWRELLEYRRTTGDLEAEFDVWTKQIIKV